MNLSRNTMISLIAAIMTVSLIPSSAAAEEKPEISMRISPRTISFDTSAADSDAEVPEVPVIAPIEPAVHSNGNAPGAIEAADESDSADKGASGDAGSGNLASAGPPSAAQQINKDPRLAEHELEGIASWYGGKFQGRLTANGETFDTNELTAAHKTLPFDTIVRVHNIQNGDSVDLRINDRGPFVEGRIIDLSRAGAEAIGMSGTGIAPVIVEVLDYREPSPYRVLQIAAFGDPDNAEQLVIELKRAGLAPEIEAASNGILRVIIPGIHLNELAQVRTTLAGVGYPDVLVRSR
ncbi:septal ring lytic transglycosylase RlpA family protein [Spirochaeta dissipatitropha]